MRSSSTGSSPRRRGTLPHCRRHPGCARFIPAQAGNTCPPFADIWLGTVHPRAGGEHRLTEAGDWLSGGSSPRRRGTRAPDSRGGAGSRFIPAQAGNTWTRGVTMSRIAVHPRAGGEHCAVCRHVPDAAGSSPRRRGTLVGGRGPAGRHRFIPAQAGNTAVDQRHLRFAPVHPRAGGEHANSRISLIPHRGSSPRRRGTLLRPDRLRRQLRFIPAQAGNTAASDRPRPRPPVHPRAGGEHDVSSAPLW